MTTIFPDVFTNFSTTLIAQHATGSGTIRLSPAAVAKLSTISASEPVWATVIRRNDLAQDQLADPPYMAVFRCESITNDALEITSVLDGVDQNFAKNDYVAINDVAGTFRLVFDAINALEAGSGGGGMAIGGAITGGAVAGNTLVIGTGGTLQQADTMCTSATGCPLTLKSSANLGGTYTAENSGIFLYNAAGVEMLRIVAADPDDDNYNAVNLYIGQRAGLSQPIANDPSAGYYNIGIGAEALGSNTSGSNNTVVGNWALGSVTTGSDNTILGYGAGAFIVTGSGNVLIGDSAGFSPLTPPDITNAIGIGHDVVVLASNSAVIGNASVTDVFLGSEAAKASLHARLPLKLVSSGAVNGPISTYTANNCGIFMHNEAGVEMLRIVAGDPEGQHEGALNLFIGCRAGFSRPISNTVDSGHNNIGIGYEALYSVTDGGRNIAIGVNAQRAVTGGDYNTSVGDWSLHLSTGNENTGVGTSVLQSLATGDNNTAIGESAGIRFAGGSNNTFLGAGAGGDAFPWTLNYSNVLCVGFDAQVTASNRAVIGNANVSDVFFGSESAAARLYASGLTSSGIISFEAPTTAAPTPPTRPQARIFAAWADDTDSSRRGQIAFVVCDWTGTEKEGLSITSDGTRANVFAAGSVTADHFIGDGSLLTNLPSAGGGGMTIGAAVTGGTADRGLYVDGSGNLADTHLQVKTIAANHFAIGLTNAGTWVGTDTFTITLGDIGIAPYLRWNPANAGLDIANTSSGPITYAASYGTGHIFTCTSFPSFVIGQSDGISGGFYASTRTNVPDGGGWSGHVIRAAGASAGPLLIFQRVASTLTVRNSAIIDSVWADDFDLSRKGKLALKVCDVSGDDKTGLTIESDGAKAVVTMPGRVTPVTTASDGSTITFDCSVTDWHPVTLTLGGNRTLAVTNDSTRQSFFVELIQGGSGNNTVTWWSGIKWVAGTVPTLTTTVGKSDVFGFRKTGTGAYYGFVVGQNL